jgi:predicted protein tyrosine phosphatase
MKGTAYGSPANDNNVKGFMKEKLKILFVCTFNRMRSKTAEEIYKDDQRFEVKSAGVDEYAEVPVNLELLLWADYIAVMEEFHRKWLSLNYPIISSNKEILCLGIPDEFDFMDPLLEVLLKEKVEAMFKKE